MKKISVSLEPYVKRASHLLNTTFSAIYYDSYFRDLVLSLNAQISTLKLNSISVDDLVNNSYDDIFETALRIRNHTFFALSIADKPKRVEECKMLYNSINQNFGSFENFRSQFFKSIILNEETTWIWLVKKANGRMFYLSSRDEIQPFGENIIPLMACYVIGKNQFTNNESIEGYLENFWKHIDWSFIEINLKENSPLKINPFLMN